jgi:hypothetical protein
LKPRLTEHARFEATRRNISDEDIASVVSAPQQRLPSSKGRVILQSKYYDAGEGKEMLLMFNIVTVYKSSKIDKYWRI